MASVKFDGLGVALITPFKNDKSVDFDCLEKITEHVIAGGCDYIVALGTTAETPTLSYQEKEAITATIRKVNNGRVPLVIGIGGNSTQNVINDIKSRDLDGFNAILSVTPYYNKPSQEGLYQHFKAISENSPLPIILYNVPGRTGVNLTSRTTIRLTHLENICGIKEASGNMDQCKEIINEVSENFFVCSGNDSDICKLMNIGGSGVISVLANAFPKEVKSIVESCRNGKFADAEVELEKYKDLIKHLFEDGNPSGIKALMNHLGFANNILRLPLVPVSLTTYNNIVKASKNFFQNPDEKK